MPPIERVFIPWGEFKRDQRLFGGGAAEGRLLACRQVVPVYGTYAVSPTWTPSTSTWDGASATTAALGLHAHPSGAAAYLAYMGDTTKLWELAPTTSFTRTDKSRMGPAYAADSTTGWNGASFGDSVVMTNYNDAVQLLLAGGANFQDMITSTFAPRFKHVVSLKNNLVGLNCNLPAAYDTLAAGANPNLVVWSQNDNVRAFGGPNLDPELTGADFQPLLNDFGEITGGIGGEFVLIAQQRGWVRMEGPSGSAFSFRVIVAGIGCRCPKSIGYFDGDVYFWGPSGPSRLRGGEGPVEVLASEKLVRTLLDNVTGFSPDSVLAAINPRHVGFVCDPVNRLIGWSLTPSNRTGTREGSLVVVYNVDESRFSFFDCVTSSATNTAGLLFPAYHIPLTESWLPFRDTLAVLRDVGPSQTDDYIGVPVYGVGSAGTQPTFASSYIQLSPDRVSRIIRVRPVASVSVPSRSGTRDLAMTVTVRSKNRVWDAPEAFGPFNNADNVDGHGWVTVPATKSADFHQVEVTLTSAAVDISTVAEMKGVEVEILLGGAYGA